MTKAIVEIPPGMRRGCEPVARIVELGDLVVPGRDLRCPRCGGVWFTVEAGEDGSLALACGREPTYIRVLIPQESEVTSGRVRNRHRYSIRDLVRHLSPRAANKTRQVTESD